MRDIVEEFNSVQLAQTFQALKVEEDDVAQDILKLEFPEEKLPRTTVRTLSDIHAGNILTVRFLRVPRRAFNTSSAECVKSLSLPSKIRPDFQFLPDRYETTFADVLLTTSADRTLKLTSLETGEVEDIFDHHKAAVLCVAPHPIEPRLVATSSMDGTATIVDLVKREVIQTFKHAKFVNRVVFSPDGKWLATASYDKTIALYSLFPSLAPSPTEDLDEGLEQDPLDLPCPLRWELRRNFECGGNPEGLVFGPLAKGEENWLAYTERCVFKTSSSRRAMLTVFFRV